MKKNLLLLATLALSPTLVGFLPPEYPVNVGPFWWGEPIIWAKQDCPSFLPIVPFKHSQVIPFQCTSKEGTLYGLVFDRSTNKLESVAFSLTDTEYAQCTQDIENLVQKGPKYSWDAYNGQWVGGFEYSSDGHEYWEADYGIYENGSNMGKIGQVICTKPTGDCDSDCQPKVAFTIEL